MYNTVSVLNANQLYTSTVVNFSIMYVLPQQNLKKKSHLCLVPV